MRPAVEIGTDRRGLIILSGGERGRDGGKEIDGCAGVGAIDDAGDGWPERDEQNKGEGEGKEGVEKEEFLADAHPGEHASAAGRAGDHFGDDAARAGADGARGGRGGGIWSALGHGLRGILRSD